MRKKISYLVILQCFLMSGTMANASSLELGIYSEYNDAIGKINIYTCDDGELLVEFDSNKCEASKACTKRTGLFKKVKPNRIGDSLLLIENSEEALLMSSGPEEGSFSLEYYTPNGKIELKSKLGYKISLNPKNTNCKN